MTDYIARVKYTDVREITVEADSDEEAEQKYQEGDWVSEDTVDFYADEEISGLKKKA